MKNVNALSKSTLIAALALIMGGCTDSRRNVVLGEKDTSETDTMYVVRAVHAFNGTRTVLLSDGGSELLHKWEAFQESGVDGTMAQSGDTVLVDKKMGFIVRNLTLEHQAARYMRGRQK